MKRRLEDRGESWRNVTRKLLKGIRNKGGLGAKSIQGKRRSEGRKNNGDVFLVYVLVMLLKSQRLKFIRECNGKTHIKSVHVLELGRF